jgi:hypothetical protein
MRRGVDFLIRGEWSAIRNLAKKLPGAEWPVNRELRVCGDVILRQPVRDLAGVASVQRERWGDSL